MALLLGARTLPGALGLATRNKDATISILLWTRTPAQQPTQALVQAYGSSLWGPFGSCEDLVHVRRHLFLESFLLRLLFGFLSLGEHVLATRLSLLRTWSTSKCLTKMTNVHYEQVHAFTIPEHAQVLVT